MIIIIIIILLSFSMGVLKTKVTILLYPNLPNYFLLNFGN